MCAIGASGIAAVTYYLMDDKKKEQVNQKVKSTVNQIKNMGKNDLPIEEAGHPEKDNLDNADMVAEGSQFGVNYYNKVRQ